MAKVQAGVPAMERDLGILDAAFGKSKWLAGDELSLADLLLAPILQTASMFPEGQTAIGKVKNVSRAFGELSSRESFKTVHAGVFG
jgi:glutathione S-transferase